MFCVKCSVYVLSQWMSVTAQTKIFLHKSVRQKKSNMWGHALFQGWIYSASTLNLPSAAMSSIIFLQMLTAFYDFSHTGNIFHGSSGLGNFFFFFYFQIPWCFKISMTCKKKEKKEENKKSWTDNTNITIYWPDHNICLPASYWHILHDSNLQQIQQQF